MHGNFGLFPPEKTSSHSINQSRRAWATGRFSQSDAANRAKNELGQNFPSTNAPVSSVRRHFLSALGPVNTQRQELGQGGGATRLVNCVTQCFPLFFCIQWLRVSMPPAVSSTLLCQIYMESLTCAQNIGGGGWGRTHEVWGGGVGGLRHKQVCTRVDSEGLGQVRGGGGGGGTEKLFLTLPRQWIEPRVFGFEFRL